MTRTVEGKRFREERNSNTETVCQEPCGLVGSSVISDPGIPGWNSTSVNSLLGVEHPPPTLLLTGDLNIDILDTKHPHYNHLHSFLATHNLTNHVSSPTRCSSARNSCLDLLLCQDATLFNSCASQPTTVPTDQTTDYQSAVARHLAESKECAMAYSDSSFRVVRACHLNLNLEIMEALYIKALAPNLCVQKSSITHLQLFRHR